MQKTAGGSGKDSAARREGAGSLPVELGSACQCALGLHCSVSATFNAVFKVLISR